MICVLNNGTSSGDAGIDRTLNGGLRLRDADPVSTSLRRKPLSALSIAAEAALHGAEDPSLQKIEMSSLLVSERIPERSEAWIVEILMPPTGATPERRCWRQLPAIKGRAKDFDPIAAPDRGCIFRYSDRTEDQHRRAACVSRLHGSQGYGS